MGTKMKHMDLGELVTSYLLGESASSLSKRFGVSVWTIIDRLRRLDIEVRSAKEQNRRFIGEVTTDDFTLREMVDGIILGDGYIDPKGILHLEQAVVRQSWVENVQCLLRAVGCESKIIPVPARTRQIEGRTIIGQPGVVLYTPSYVEMQAERQRWFHGDRRAVQHDLRLTTLTVAQWFSGDGTYSTTSRLSFCTHRYSRQDVEFLIGRFATDLDVYATINNTIRDGQYTIGIHRAEQALKLAELMRPHLHECCLYKLQHIRPDARGHLLPSQAEDIRHRAAAGESVASLASAFDRSDSAIQNIIAGRSHRDV